MNRTVLLDPADTVILLLDHQNGLFQTVKDVPLAELRTNTVVLAKVAKLAKIPLITTASVPDGPNGPLMHELQEMAPDAQPGFEDIEIAILVEDAGIQPTARGKNSAVARCGPGQSPSCFPW